MSSLYLIPQTARGQADEQARVANEVTSLICSGHQLLNESGLPRIFPKVGWTVVGHANGRDPAWVVVEDAADPTYLLTVRRCANAIKGPGGFRQYRHTIRLTTASRLPWRRWRTLGQNITRPEHLSAHLALLDARR
jgi:hypothetical protein